MKKLLTTISILLIATASYAELWLPLEKYVETCSLIVLCKTELKGDKVQYKVIETWKGEYSPELFYYTPPEGYLFTNTWHGAESPSGGKEIIFFFTNNNQPNWADGKLVSHSTAFSITDGKLIYASTSMERKEYSLEEFKDAILSVVNNNENTTLHSTTYTVERVIDGDTLVVTTPEGKSEKVQLIGIKAPESQPNDKAKRDSERTGQDVETINKMGQEATEFVKFVEGREIKLEMDVQEKAKYGRLLAYVWMPFDYYNQFPEEIFELYNKRVKGQLDYTKSTDILETALWEYDVLLNALIVDAGYATPMTIPPNVKYADLFKELYKEAREQKRELWKDN